MKGSVYRRCGACNKRVETDTCCPTGTVSWCYRVDVGTGNKRKQRRGTGFKRKKDAETAMAAEVTDRRRGTYVERSTLTLEEFATGTFLPLIDSQVAAGSLEPNTASDYRRNIEGRAVPIIGDLPLQDVKPSDLQKLYGKLASKYASKTISNTARTLHRLFEVAIDDGVVRTNPCARARAPKVEQKPQTVLTPREVETVMAWVAENEPQHLALFLLYVTTGLRRGEALGLRWSDIDLHATVKNDDGEIVPAPMATVVQQVTTEDGAVVLKDRTKSGKQRNIPLLDQVVAALDQHREQQRSVTPAAWRKDGLVFAREDGSPLRPRQVNRLLDRAIKGAGATRVTPHGLRHSVASMLLDGGAPIPVLTQLFGHASPAITMTVYAHMLEGSDRRAVTNLGTAIFGQKQAQ